MPVTLAFNDQAYLNNNETVTFASVLTAGDTTCSLTQAIRYPMSLKESQASNGVYRTDDIIWTSDTATFNIASLVPKPRDYITADGNTYTVLEAIKSPIASFYKLITRDLSLANGLTDTITIQTATISIDASGGITKSWAAVHTSIAARVQPEQTTAFEERGIKSSQVRYQVFVAVNPTVTNSAGDWGRIVFGSDTLEIDGLTRSEQIGELAVISAAKMP